MIALKIAEIMFALTLVMITIIYITQAINRQYMGVRVIIVLTTKALMFLF